MAALVDFPMAAFRHAHMSRFVSQESEDASGDFVLGLVDGLMSAPFSLGIAFEPLVAAAGGFSEPPVTGFVEDDDEDDLSLSSDSPPASPTSLPLASPWPQVPRACHMCGTSNTSFWRPGPLGRDTLCDSCGTRWVNSEAVGGLGGANPLKGTPMGPLSLRPQLLPPAAVVPILMPAPKTRTLSRANSRESSVAPSPPLSPPRHAESAPQSPMRRGAAPPSSSSSAASVPSMSKKPLAGAKRGREAEATVPAEEVSAGSGGSDAEGAAAGALATDKLQCHHCGTRCTSQWRKGPHGINTLCNACGLRWKRKGASSGLSFSRAARAAAAAAADGDGDL
eukprot:tig00020610_g12018.t1